jgi:hypothetical protein
MLRITLLLIGAMTVMAGDLVALSLPYMTEAFGGEGRGLLESRAR